MQDVTATYRNGSTAQLANIYIRGTQIKFMILPEMLKNAPMLKVRKIFYRTVVFFKTIN